MSLVSPAMSGAPVGSSMMGQDMGMINGMVPVAQDALDANDIMEVGHRLGLDPLMDVELHWIVQEFLEAPLPDGWLLVKDPQGKIHYVNQMLRLDVLENPIEPRYKKLAELMKRAKERNVPMDEVTVLELMDPVERVADVKEMAEYMGIDYMSEPHLLWIAKLCVLEALPEGWEETVDADGTVQYLNIEGGYSQDEHPTDGHFKGILERERKKKPPYPSILPEYYEYPPTRFRADKASDGSELRTYTIPNQGTWMDFYDVYGRRFWYDFDTDRVTMDYDEVRYLARIVTIQRVFRGFLVRKEIWEIHTVAKKICVAWRTRKFRRILMAENKRRGDAARLFQRMYRAREARIRNSRDCFRRLGEKGQRLGRAARNNVCQGLMNTGYSYLIVRQRVVSIQRSYRAYRLRLYMFGRYDSGGEDDDMEEDMEESVTDSSCSEAGSSARGARWGLSTRPTVLPPVGPGGGFTYPGMLRPREVGRMGWGLPDYGVGAGPGGMDGEEGGGGEARKPRRRRRKRRRAGGLRGKELAAGGRNKARGGGGKGRKGFLAGGAEPTGGVEGDGDDGEGDDDDGGGTFDDGELLEGAGEGGDEALVDSDGGSEGGKREGAGGGSLGRQNGSAVRIQAHYRGRRERRRHQERRRRHHIDAQESSAATVTQARNNGDRQEQGRGGQGSPPPTPPAGGAGPQHGARVARYGASPSPPHTPIPAEPSELLLHGEPVLREEPSGGTVLIGEPSDASVLRWADEEGEELEGEDSLMLRAEDSDPLLGMQGPDLLSGGASPDPRAHRGGALRAERSAGALHSTMGGYSLVMSSTQSAASTMTNLVAMSPDPHRHKGNTSPGPPLDVESSGDWGLLGGGAGLSAESSPAVTGRIMASLPPLSPASQGPGPSPRSARLHDPAGGVAALVEGEALLLDGESDENGAPAAAAGEEEVDPFEASIAVSGLPAVAGESRLDTVEATAAPASASSLPPVLPSAGVGAVDRAASPLLVAGGAGAVALPAVAGAPPRPPSSMAQRRSPSPSSRPVTPAADVSIDAGGGLPPVPGAGPAPSSEPEAPAASAVPLPPVPTAAAEPAEAPAAPVTEPLLLGLTSLPPPTFPPLKGAVSVLPPAEGEAADDGLPAEGTAELASPGTPRRGAPRGPSLTPVGEDVAVESLRLRKVGGGTSDSGPFGGPSVAAQVLEGRLTAQNGDVAALIEEMVDGADDPGATLRNLRNLLGTYEQQYAAAAAAVGSPQNSVLFMPPELGEEAEAYSGGEALSGPPPPDLVAAVARGLATALRSALVKSDSGPLAGLTRSMTYHPGDGAHALSAAAQSSRQSVDSVDQMRHDAALESLAACLGGGGGVPEPPPHSHNLAPGSALGDSSGSIDVAGAMRRSGSSSVGAGGSAMTSPGEPCVEVVGGGGGWGGMLASPGPGAYSGGGGYGSAATTPGVAVVEIAGGGGMWGGMLASPMQPSPVAAAAPPTAVDTNRGSPSVRRSLNVELGGPAPPRRSPTPPSTPPTRSPLSSRVGARVPPALDVSFSEDLVAEEGNAGRNHVEGAGVQHGAHGGSPRARRHVSGGGGSGSLSARERRDSARGGGALAGSLGPLTAPAAGGGRVVGWAEEAPTPRPASIDPSLLVIKVPVLALDRLMANRPPSPPPRDLPFQLPPPSLRGARREGGSSLLADIGLPNASALRGGHLSGRQSALGKWAEAGSFIKLTRRASNAFQEMPLQPENDGPDLEELLKSARGMPGARRGKGGRPGGARTARMARRRH